MACPHPLPAVNPTNSTRLARAVVAVAAVLALAVSNDCRAEEIYSALTEATGGALGTQFGDKYIALGFRTTATDYRLTSIDMGIRVVDSEVPGPGPFDPAVIVPRSGSVTFSIYGADESGAPPMFPTSSRTSRAASPSRTSRMGRRATPCTR